MIWSVVWSTSTLTRAWAAAPSILFSPPLSLVRVRPSLPLYQKKSYVLHHAPVQCQGKNKKKMRGVGFEPTRFPTAVQESKSQEQDVQVIRPKHSALTTRLYDLLAG